MSNTLPTAEQIEAWGYLESKSASQELLGKTADELCEELRKGATFNHADDLGIVGPVAFEYYLPAFTSFLKEQGDDIIVSGTLSAIYQQFVANGRAYAVNQVRDLARTVLVNYDKFEINESIYGALGKAFEELLSEIAREEAGERIDWRGRKGWWQPQRPPPA